jgi:hypothetical protein
MAERVQLVAIASATTVLLAVVVPSWVLALVIVILGPPLAVAIVKHPATARQAIKLLRDLLAAPRDFR